VFDVNDICKAVSGYPLAIELAAAWVNHLSASELARTLHQDALHLTSPFRDVPQRHHSVYLVFEHSWNRLNLAARSLLQQLAVFRGGFTLEAAQVVTGATANALRELTDKSLVQVDSNSRFTFHALLHEYLRSKLAETPELEVRVKTQHAHYYSSKLAELNVLAHGGVSFAAISLVQQEEGNLLHLIEWALTTRAYNVLTSLTEPLLWYFPVRGRFQDGMQLCYVSVCWLPYGSKTWLHIRRGLPFSQASVGYSDLLATWPHLKNLRTGSTLCPNPQ
jgi:predicted ATPase